MSLIDRIKAKSAEIDQAKKYFDIISNSLSQMDILSSLYCSGSLSKGNLYHPVTNIDIVMLLKDNTQLPKEICDKILSHLRYNIILNIDIELKEKNQIILKFVEDKFITNIYPVFRRNTSTLDRTVYEIPSITDNTYSELIVNYPNDSGIENYKLYKSIGGEQYLEHLLNKYKYLMKYIEHKERNINIDIKSRIIEAMQLEKENKFSDSLNIWKSIFNI